MTEFFDECQVFALYKKNNVQDQPPSFKVKIIPLNDASNQHQKLITKYLTKTDNSSIMQAYLKNRAVAKNSKQTISN